MIQVMKLSYHEVTFTSEIDTLPQASGKFTLAAVYFGAKQTHWIG